MDTANPLNSYLVSSLMSKASEITTFEGFLESAPQLILQLTVFLKSGNMSMIIINITFQLGLKLSRVKLLGHFPQEGKAPLGKAVLCSPFIGGEKRSRE